MLNNKKLKVHIQLLVDLLKGMKLIIEIKTKLSLLCIYTKLQFF